jgi:hypothetical protein
MGMMPRHAYAFLLVAASIPLVACDSPHLCAYCLGGFGGYGGEPSSSSSSSSSGTGGTGGGAVWTKPDCTLITGTAAVTFTFDEGKTLAGNDDALLPIVYTFGLAALDTPNTLVAESAGTILRSENAGCKWSPIGTVEAYPLTLAAARGGRAYGFKDNDAPLYRVDGKTITKLTGPAMSVLGVGVDPADGDHLRLGDETGQIWESKDAGASWGMAGVPAPVGDLPLVYRYAFDPHDLNHVLVGCATNGALVSTDGGSTWKTATGLAANGVNVFSIVVAPSNGQIVWAEGIDLDHTNDPVAGGRTIWRSADGGQTFTKVTEQTADVTIRNQELLAAHPTDTNVLYFVFGTYFQNYGTDIYRYDHTTMAVTKTHNPYNDISSVAFSPVDPTVMYLGLTADAH